MQSQASGPRRFASAASVASSSREARGTLTSNPIHRNCSSRAAAVAAPTAVAVGGRATQTQQRQSRGDSSQACELIRIARAACKMHASLDACMHLFIGVWGFPERLTLGARHLLSPLQLVTPHQRLKKKAPKHMCEHRYMHACAHAYIIYACMHLDAFMHTLARLPARGTLKGR